MGGGARGRRGGQVAATCSPRGIAEEVEFMDRVTEVAGFVERQPEWMVLLGAEATEPETEYGWIEAGGSVGAAGGELVYRIRRVHGKHWQEGRARHVHT